MERAGDIRAQIAANNLGAMRMTEHIKKYSVNTYMEFAASIIEYSEERMRHAITKILEGTYTAEDLMDDDGVTDQPVNLELSYPLRVERYELIPDSCGNGKFRGGSGIKRAIKVRVDDTTLSIQSE
jgi:N-methylhydantoinase B